MNNENPIIGTLRQHWLALIAIFSVGAAYVGNTSTPTNPESTKANTNAIVSFRERIWDDPFAQTTQATNALQAKTNEKPVLPSQRPLEISEIFTFMLSLVENKESNILVCLNVLDAQDVPSAVESRIRTRHAFELGMSSMGFTSVDPDTISFLQISIPASPSPLAKTNQPEKILLPIKLYQQRESKKVVLNIWFNQNFLGEQPLPILASVLQDIELNHRAVSKLAIIGPGDSDMLKAMKPIAGHYAQHELWGSFWLDATSKIKDNSTPQEKKSSQRTGLQGWQEMFWISTSSTVPRDVLWGSLPEQPPKESSSSEFKFRSFIDSDRRLISSLAKELKLRIGTYSPKQHDILLFVEQDKEYGRNLGRQLTEKMEGDFNMQTVPYLRSLSRDPKSKVEASGVDVTDYFERTLKRLTDSENFANTKVVSPAAIGILGGSWNDKIVLVDTVRRRFPQALIFTNDYDERYGLSGNLTSTRNLLIVSHGDPVTHTDSQDAEISSTAFRDEYQAAYFKGITSLIRKAIPTAIQPTQSDSLDTADRKEVAIYEVGNHGILKLTDESIKDENPYRFLAVIAVLVTISALVLFPHLIHVVQPRVASSTTSTDSTKVSQQNVSPTAETKPSQSNSTELQNTTPLENAALSGTLESLPSTNYPSNTPLDASSEESSGEEKLDLLTPASLVVSVLASIVCILPIYVCEQEKTWSLGLISGVSVIPSIVVLILTLPWSWRRTLRGEICIGSDASKKRASSDLLQKSVKSEPTGVETLSQAYNLNKLTDERLDLWTKDKWPSLNAFLKKWFGLIVVFVMLLIGLAVFLVADDLWLLQLSLLSVVGLLLPVSSNLKFAIFVTTSLSLVVQIVRLGAYEYSHVPARDVLLRMIGDASFMVAYWWLLTGLVKMTLYNIAILMDFEKKCRAFLKPPKDAKPENLAKINQEVFQSFENVNEYSGSVSRQLFTLTLVGVVVCCARLPLFDAWGMSVGTWFTIIFPMALPVVISLNLKRSAQRLKSRVKDRLANLKGAVVGEDPANLQSKIDNCKKGAFAPIGEDPVIASILAIGLAFFSGPLKEVIPVAKTIFTFWVV